LGTDGNADFQTMAVTVCRKLIKKLDQDHLFAIFGQVVTEVKRSTDENFVRQSFMFAEDLLALKVCPSADLEHLAAATVLGRLAIFGPRMPYDIENTAIRFPQFLRTYVDIFPKKSGWIVHAVVRWLPRVVTPLVVPICDVIVAAFRHDLLDKSDGKVVFDVLVSEIGDERFKFEDVRVAIHFCQRLRRKFALGQEELLVCLERLWEGHRQRTAFIKLLVPMFLEMFADRSFAVEGDFQVFADIVELVVGQEYSFDFPRLLHCFVQMHDHAVPFASLDEQAAMVFATFLTKSQAALDEEGFDSELLKNMHRCLKQIGGNNRVALRGIERAYASNPALTARLKTLLRAPQRPEFH
jgi:hypothetical protein